MTVPVTIRVLDFTGCPFAVSAEDGQRVCDQIAPLLPVGQPLRCRTELKEGTHHA